MTTPQTTPLTYNGYVTQVATMAVVDTTTSSGVVVGVDPAFNAIIPQMLNYAELRIQRDLDLLPSQTSRTYTLTTGSNTLQIDVDDFVTIQTIQVTDGNGSITPLLPVTKEVLQNVYNSPSSTDTPVWFAMYGGDLSTGGNTSNNIIVGPYPDANYPVTITGTVRLPTLYQYSTSGTAASTSTTFISTYLPDLLIQASMIYIAQFQRNFGSASNDPAMGPTYELQYQNLLKNAIVEEARKKFTAGGWSSMSPAVAATPSR